MTKEQYLFLKLLEECAEISHAASKAMQFGLYNYHPETKVTNLQKLQEEMIDFFSVLEEIEEHCEIYFPRKGSDFCKVKIKRWMLVSNVSRESDE